MRDLDFDAFFNSLLVLAIACDLGEQLERLESSSFLALLVEIFTVITLIHVSLLFEMVSSQTLKGSSSASQRLPLLNGPL